ncbi:MAG: Pup--protein ligase [Flaviflexus sp.]|nr:Pup--protein ligase [Flaviflexus sp.]
MIPPRILGIETEYGLVAHGPGAKNCTPEDAAQALFSRVMELARTTNTFLSNGSRLYLDVGAHPEYATCECTTIEDLVAHDRAGEIIYQQMADRVNEQFAQAGRGKTLHLFKNNVDSQGNSYGCHENYLLRRRRDFRQRVENLIPHFITRQIYAGAGIIRRTAAGPEFAISQRADQMWDAVSSASTRSRPIVNTRDEPHGDIDKYRRMHVIVGDSNMCEVATGLKVATTEMLIQMMEDGAILPDLELADPMLAIRNISHDLTLTEKVELASGSTATAIDIQRAFAEAAHAHYDKKGYFADLDPVRTKLATLWIDTLDALAAKDVDKVATTIDWVAKYRLLERYRQRAGLALDHPKMLRLEYAYHDISERDGLAISMMSSGLLGRLVTDEQIAHAVDHPPHTRALLRGRFVAAASAARRDYLADWTNLRLLEVSGARTVTLDDPFATTDDRVDQLMEAL